MSIKKYFFAPLASGLGATRRAAMLLLVMMLTTTTAWATDVTLSGSDNYTAQDGDVLTGTPQRISGHRNPSAAVRQRMPSTLMPVPT